MPSEVKHSVSLVWSRGPPVLCEGVTFGRSGATPSRSALPIRAANTNQLPPPPAPTDILWSLLSKPTFGPPVPMVVGNADSTAQELARLSDAVGGVYVHSGDTSCRNTRSYSGGDLARKPSNHCSSQPIPSNQLRTCSADEVPSLDDHAPKGNRARTGAPPSRPQSAFATVHRHTAIQTQTKSPLRPAMSAATLRLVRQASVDGKLRSSNVVVPAAPMPALAVPAAAVPSPKATSATALFAPSPAPPAAVKGRELSSAQKASSAAATATNCSRPASASAAASPSVAVSPSAATKSSSRPATATKVRPGSAAAVAAANQAAPSKVPRQVRRAFNERATNSGGCQPAGTAFVAGPTVPSLSLPSATWRPAVGGLTRNQPSQQQRPMHPLPTPLWFGQSQKQRPTAKYTYVPRPSSAAAVLQTDARDSVLASYVPWLPHHIVELQEAVLVGRSVGGGPRSSLANSASTASLDGYHEPYAGAVSGNPPAGIPGLSSTALPLDLKATEFWTHAPSVRRRYLDYIEMHGQPTDALKSLYTALSTAVVSAYGAKLHTARDALMASVRADSPPEGARPTTSGSLVSLSGMTQPQANPSTSRAELIAMAQRGDGLQSHPSVERECAHRLQDCTHSFAAGLNEALYSVPPRPAVWGENNDEVTSVSELVVPLTGSACDSMLATIRIGPFHPGLNCRDGSISSSSSRAAQLWTVNK